LIRQAYRLTCWSQTTGLGWSSVNVRAYRRGPQPSPQRPNPPAPAAAAPAGVFILQDFGDIFHILASARQNTIVGLELAMMRWSTPPPPRTAARRSPTTATRHLRTGACGSSRGTAVSSRPTASPNTRRSRTPRPRRSPCVVRVERGPGACGHLD